METTFDWKQLSKEQPVSYKRVIIHSNRTSKAKWFIGFYNGFNRTDAVDNKTYCYEFDVHKINLPALNIQHKVIRRVLEIDAPSCHWDYYNPHWKAPNSFDNVEEFFYKE